MRPKEAHRLACGRSSDGRPERRESLRPRRARASDDLRAGDGRSRLPQGRSPARIVRSGDQRRRADLRRPGPVRQRRGFARVAGGPSRRGSARPCRDALHPGRYRPMRQRSVAIRRGELRRAGPRGEAHHRRDGRAPGARSHIGCGAAPRQSPVRGHRGARHDRRRPGGARRGVAGVDASRGHDLGLLRLCDSVQSRPGVPVLGLGPAVAVGASGARRHCPGDAGRRLYRAPAVCAEGAARPD